MPDSPTQTIKGRSRGILAMKREVRHGAVEPRKPCFTEAELAEINARYDRENGFDLSMPTVHQNPARRPETVFEQPSN